MGGLTKSIIKCYGLEYQYFMGDLAKNDEEKQAYFVDLPTSKDLRGALTSVEQLSSIPIEIQRIFYMYEMTQDRGGHAHIDTDQVVVAVHGSMLFTLTFPDGSTTEFSLNDPGQGLYIPRLSFIEITNISSDAVCLVLANTFYDIKKSLRTIEDYKSYIADL